jgi:hypothetical protein
MISKIKIMKTVNLCNWRIDYDLRWNYKQTKIKQHLNL